MPDPIITSSANPRLKSLLALRRRRTRDATGGCVVEGLEETALAVRAGVRLRSLYLCPELFGPGAAAALPPLRAGADEIIRLGRAAFEKVAYREGPDGVLAVTAAPGRALGDLLGETGTRGRQPGPHRAPPLILLAEGVEKPGNLGAMLRTADGAGADAVVAADPVTDWGNPNVIRASKGTVFAVPVASGTTAEALEWLADRGIALVATTPDTDLDYADVDYSGPVAIAVGAEKTGLTSHVLAAAGHRVRIPMAGHADSLNVATSAAIVVYEAVRQRRSGPTGIPGVRAVSP